MKRFVDLIHAKKEGCELADNDIQNMITDYCNGRIPDYQMSAMLMAICFNGLSDRELTTMTIAMRDSGGINDLSGIPGIKVDKHSTGGVGDKTTLIIGPIVASCGVPVAKMSGRGLGFTGGTIDKLESIPGFRIDLSTEEFFHAIETGNICIVGQTADLAPADKKVYALRDVTATVDSIPLIAASVMSKKLASGSDAILLDVTYGSGAFMKEYDRALELAEKMVHIGNHAGKTTVAQLTSMEEPLGFAIGNWLEVKEAIATLHSAGPEDLMTVCYTLAAHMISLGKQIPFDTAMAEAKQAVASGHAWNTFMNMVNCQGGDVSLIQNPEMAPAAAVTIDFVCPESGYISSIDTEGLGITAGILGAGRSKIEDTIDYAAGILLKHKLNDFVHKGEIIATLHTSNQSAAQAALEKIQNCFTISKHPGPQIKLIGDVVQGTAPDTAPL